ncbi:MAG: response regulator [Deltaproteobacteria bacterium]|uniref:Response regulator n=1 Tax=Candidatus Zymogenus saltonus TaxID=2844893 RepID=A0A9D8KDW8_9DELT|nr:response regulator [Candidatus Zymogenus saltonus]
MSRILVVDDEVVISMQLEERLSSMGYDVVGRASSGKEAVDKAKKLSPDLILMDIVMPGEMDGIDASRIVKEDLDIPVIFLTAFADDENIMKAKETEPFGYIVKPFQERALKAAIEVALYNKHVGVQLRRSERKYRTILESANDPMLIFEALNLGVIETNRRAQEFFGISNDRFSEMDVSRLFPEDEIKNFNKLIKKLLKSKKPVLENFFVMGDNREVVPVEVSACAASLEDEVVIIAILRDITKRELADWEKKILVELKRSIEKAKRLSGIIPICAVCKKIRNKEGKWIQLEVFIRDNSEADFSHGICPDCKATYYSSYE